jgi:hypothetical protein
MKPIMPLRRVSAAGVLGSGARAGVGVKGRATADSTPIVVALANMPDGRNRFLRFNDGRNFVRAAEDFDTRASDTMTGLSHRGATNEQRHINPGVPVPAAH